MLFLLYVSMLMVVCMPLCVECGHEISADADFCENCGAPTSHASKREKTHFLPKFGHLSRPLKATLLLILIIGICLLATSFAFQPQSITPEYGASLRSQVTQLKSQLEKLQQDAGSLQSQISDLALQISSSQNALTKIEDEIEGSQSQLAALGTEIASLRQQLQDVRAQITSKKTELADAEEELNKARSDLQEATNKVQQLETALPKQQATLQSYTASRDQAQSRHDSLLAEWNSRASAYNVRLAAYNQKKQEYDSRWATLNGKILGCVAQSAICVLVCSFVSEACLMCLGSCPGISDMFGEYNALEQLKGWLNTESAWLQSEEKQLDTLKNELDRATSDLANWNAKVQNQQGLVAKTQSDLNYWNTKKSELTSQLTVVQNNVNQLTEQVGNLESQESQRQASLDSDLAKEQQLKSLVQDDEAKATVLQDSIASNSSHKSVLESTLQKCQADTQGTRQQIDTLNLELYRVAAHPYLRWGGLGILTLGIAALAVTGVGLATIVSNLQAGIGRVTGLTRRLRLGKTALEMQAPAETPMELTATAAPVHTFLASTSVEVPASAPSKVPVITSAPTPLTSRQRRVRSQVSPRKATRPTRRKRRVAKARKKERTDKTSH